MLPTVQRIAALLCSDCLCLIPGLCRLNTPRTSDASGSPRAPLVHCHNRDCLSEITAATTKLPCSGSAETNSEDPAVRENPGSLLSSSCRPCWVVASAPPDGTRTAYDCLAIRSISDRADSASGTTPRSPIANLLLRAHSQALAFETPGRPSRVERVPGTVLSTRQPEPFPD